MEALQWWESLPKHQVNPGHFHLVKGGICYANIAGAASIRLWVQEDECCHWDIKDYTDIVNFGNGDRREIFNFEASLDFAGRGGNIGIYFAILNLDKKVGEKFDRDIYSYYKCSTTYYKQIENLINDLREAGY